MLAGKKVVHADEHWFTISHWLCNEYVMGFECYKIVGFGEDNERWYEGLEDSDNTTDIDKAQKYLSGEIKWDGCSNMKFDEQEKCMLHFCGTHRLKQLSGLFKTLYEIAGKEIKHADLKNFEW